MAEALCKGREAYALPAGKLRDVQMSGTNTEPGAQRVGRGPASLVDKQLDHLEIMVEYASRGCAAAAMPSFDHQYWEKRIRSLGHTYELIASQQQRIEKLLDRLARQAGIALKRRAAA
jgi:hypothetical protein